MFGLMSTAWCRKPGIAAVGFLLSVFLTCIFSIRPSNNCGAILSGSSQKAHHISTLLATKHFFGWNKFELAPSHYCNSGWLSAAPVSLAVNLLQGARSHQAVTRGTFCTTWQCRSPCASCVRLHGGCISHPGPEAGSAGGSVGGGLGLAEGLGSWAAECLGAVSWTSLPPSLMQFQNQFFPYPNFEDKFEQVTVVSVSGICGYCKISQNPSCLGTQQRIWVFDFKPVSSNNLTWRGAMLGDFKG